MAWLERGVRVDLQFRPVVLVLQVVQDLQREVVVVRGMRGALDRRVGCDEGREGGAGRWRGGGGGHSSGESRSAGEAFDAGV